MSQLDKLPLVELLRHVSQSKAKLSFLGKDLETITGSLGEAVAVSVNSSSPRLLSDPSGYKTYDAFTLLLFFECRGLPQGEYLNKALDLSTRLSRPLVNVSVLDRKDLLDYWAGTSDAYTGKAIPTQGLDDTAGDSLADDDDAMDIIPDAPSATMAMAKTYLPPTLSASDKLFCSNVKTRERTLRTSASVLLAKTTRSFEVVRGLMTEHLKGVDVTAGGKKGAPVDASLPVKKKHKGDTAAGAVPRKPSSSSTAPATKSPAAASPSKPKKPAGLPIIIIPNAVQSLITLYNAKDLLQDQKYIASDTRRNSGADKPSKVEITRDPAKVPAGVPTKYLVVDSVDSLSSQDWCVFFSLL
jgi:hypothetical protein